LCEYSVGENTLKKLKLYFIHLQKEGTEL